MTEKYIWRPELLPENCEGCIFVGPSVECPRNDTLLSSALKCIDYNNPLKTDCIAVHDEQDYIVKRAIVRLGGRI